MLIVSIRNNLAFSLVELLVTLAIVGIVAGMAIAQFNHYKSKTYDLKAELMLGNLRDALTDYAINELKNETVTIDLTSSNITNFDNLPSSVKTRLGSHDGVNLAVSLIIEAGRINFARFSTGHCKGTGGFTADGLYGPNVHAKYRCETGGMCFVPAAFVGINLRPQCY